MQELADPIISNKGKELMLHTRLGQLVDALRLYMGKTSKSATDLYKELAKETGKETGDNETISAAGIVAAFKGLNPELPELSALLGTTPEDQEKFVAAVSLIDPEGVKDGSLREAAFQDLLTRRYMCVAVISMTEELAVDSKTLRRLELNEVFELVGKEEEVEEKSKLKRVLVKAERDDLKGYVTLAALDGKPFLETFSPFLAGVRAAETGAKEVFDKVNQTISWLKQKSDELKLTPRGGPLSDVKTELTKLRVRAGKAQAVHAEAKKKISDARKLYNVQLEAQNKRRQEAADKVAADAMIGKANALVDDVLSKANAACDKASSLTSGGTAGSDAAASLSIADLREAEQELLAAVDAVLQGQDQIMKTVMDEIRNATKGPYVEARRQMFRLKVKLAPLVGNCKKQLACIQAQKSDAIREAQQAIATALREKAEKEKISLETLFANLLKSQGDRDQQDLAVVTAATLRSCLTSLDSKELEMGLQSLEAGVTLLGFHALVREYRKCTKEVALTSEFEVTGGPTVRKLDLEEIVEVIGQPRVDKTTGLQRARCRSLQDLAEGWATLRGNQGTAFLESIAKPYFIALEESPVTLLKDCVSSSEEVHKLSQGDVVEVLEGPRQEVNFEVTRARGKAPKDGKLGWVTLKDAQGRSTFELLKVLVCKGSVALTDNFDIGNCNAVRKLEFGEVLDKLEEPQLDEKRQLHRVKVRSKVDSKEGWVTMKGNQGTVYVADSSQHYTCTENVPLETALSSGSQVVRQLDQGEVFELTGEPTKEVKKGLFLARGRTSAGVEGWFPTSRMSRWSACQKCVHSTKLLDRADAEAEVLREVDVGEDVEALEVPKAVSADGKVSLYVRVRLPKDGKTGFISVKDQDQAVLRCSDDSTPVVAKGTPAPSSAPKR
eukprot:TRINITY_DN1242_c0_g1_i1.p1 TRINITY_DN1242_c0_g1~~TRINITY_DN1242_c0_g1_i1.p1  ORF type:complete len:896 (+),score=237.61 TRINITY_DN1242_c0_g1_i1:3-2690(+)